MAFSDDFTGTADQELQDRTGWTRLVDGGFRYVISSSGDGLAGKGSGGGSGFTIYTCTDQASGDHETSIVHTQQHGDYYPAAVRVVDVNNWVASRHGGTGSGGLRLYKMVAGVRTQIIGAQGSNAEPFTIRVSAEGDQYKLFENDVQIGTTQTISNAEISTAETTQGMIQSSLSAGGTKYLDDFLAAAIGGGGPTTTPKTLLHSGIGTTSLGIEVTYKLSLNASGTGINSISKLIKKTLGIVSSNVVSIVKGIKKTLAVSAAPVATLDEGLLLSHSASASASGASGVATEFILAGSGITLEGIDSLPSYNAGLNTLGVMSNLPVYMNNRAIIYSYNGTYYGTAFTEI